MWTMGLILLGTIATAWLVRASCKIDSRLYLRCLCRNPKAGRRMALTFDDGVDPQMTPRVLDLLAERGVKATFFVIGERAARHPELVRRIVSEGHTVGNHSYFHRGGFPLGSTDRIAAEIARSTAELEAIAGTRIDLFRPPFGVTNPMIGRAVRRLGMTAVGWSIRSFDTMQRPLEKTLQRVVDRFAPGAVILLHDDRPHADSLLAAILDRAEKENYEFCTINELFER